MTQPIEIPTSRYLLVLTSTALLLVSLHLILNLYHYQVGEVPWLLLQLFELDEENNVPTWFSSFILLNNAIALAIAFAQASRHQWQWLVLGFGFLLLSVDEVAGLHETFHTAIDNNWTLYAAGLVALVGASFVPFLLALPRPLAGGFILSGSIYLSGALLVEYLSRDMEEESLRYAFAVALEEGLEMAGALLFLFINLKQQRSVNPAVLINFK